MLIIDNSLLRVSYTHIVKYTKGDVLWNVLAIYSE